MSIGAGGINFICSTATDFAAESTQNQSRLDIVTSLHCCDTGSDDAIRLGVQCSAQHIIVVPCCYREHWACIHQALRTDTVLAALKHPDQRLKECVETITDCLRCGMLDAAGYDCHRLEFMSRQYGNHNVVIRAHRRYPDFDALSLAQQLEETTRRDLARSRVWDLMNVTGVRHQFYF